MPKKNVIIISVVVVCALIGGYLFWDNQQKKQAALEKKTRQETLIIAFDEMPKTLNPLYEQNATGLTLLDPIFDGLANRSGKKVRHYENGLATDFIQDDKKHNVFIIELDEDKRWHDDPKHMVTARDVRFTVECIKNEKNRSPLRGRLNQLIERVDIVESFKLRVVFKENISIHVVRDLMAFKIIPATYYGKPMSLDLRTDEVAQEFAKRPIGTGKYQFKEWKGNKITLAAAAQIANEEENEDEDEDEDENDEDVKKGVQIQNIQAILIHDQEKQAKMLIDGKVDLVLESSPKLHEMMNEKGLKHSDYVPLHFYGIAFNTISPNFTDKLVRQAISRAINKSELAKQVRSGETSRLINKGPFPHNDDKRYKKFRDHLSFSLRQAKKLLKKKGGFSTTLIYQDDASKTQERLASKIVLMLNEIGITVEPKSLGMAFDTQIANKNFEMALIRHSGFTDGYNIAHLYRSVSSRNVTGISSEKLDKILDKWENSAFWEQRLPAAKDLHRQVLNLSPYVYLFSLPTSAYYSARLNDVLIVDPNSLLGSVEEWTVTP